MTVWHWIIVLGAMALLVYAMWRSRRRKAEDPFEITKVHGWLALLVAGMTFFGPMVGFGRMSNDLAAAESQYPQLLAVAAWGTYKAAAWGTFAVAVILSIGAGARLYNSRSVSAPKQAIIALWLSGPAATVLNGFVWPGLLFGGWEMESEAISALIGSSCVAGIWTTYLLTSRRVKARFVDAGSPVPGAASAQP